MIPYGRQNINENDIQAVLRILNSILLLKDQQFLPLKKQLQKNVMHVMP